jgi:hypothetical protein
LGAADGVLLSGGMLSSVSASRRECPDACSAATTSAEKITTFIDTDNHTAKPFRIPQRTYALLH